MIEVGLVILAAGALMVLLPPLLDVDMMQAGFALQFGGIFLVLVGLITAAIFGYRANRLQATFRGSRVLAHWVYDPVQVRDLADRDLKSTKEKNRVLLLILAVFVVVCTLLLVVIGFLSGEGDNMPIFGHHGRGSGYCCSFCLWHALPATAACPAQQR